MFKIKFPKTEDGAVPVFADMLFENSTVRDMIATNVPLLSPYTKLYKVSNSCGKINPVPNSATFNLESIKDKSSGAK